MTPKLNRKVRDRLQLWIWLGVCLIIVSCSIRENIPTVVDDRVEALLRSEAARIIAVSEDRKNFSKYQFLLSDFPRKDILGLSIGDRRIYINYNLAVRALTDSNHRWLLRQVVAHEIAHETAGHANLEGAKPSGGSFAVGISAADIGLPWYVKFQNYSTEKELEADLKGLGYWNRLDWDCQIWVRILENFRQQNYAGGIFHPTEKRLQQAQNLCSLRAEEKSSPGNAPGA